MSWQLGVAVAPAAPPVPVLPPAPALPPLPLFDPSSSLESEQALANRPLAAMKPTSKETFVLPHFQASKSYRDTPLCPDARHSAVEAVGIFRAQRSGVRFGADSDAGSRSQRSNWIGALKESATSGPSSARVRRLHA
jgi:hypothetical protein